MKFFKLSFAMLSCVLLAGSTFAQDATVAVEVPLPTADAIVDSYFENTGGAEAWAALESSRAQATMAMGPMEFAGTVVAAVPNKQRIEVDVQGQQLIQAYDGETAWQINPFAGGTEPQPMSAEEAEQFTKQEFQSPFLNYADKGHTVEVVGTKEVEGTETFEVKLTKANGYVEMHYFDSEYFVPVMQSMEITSGPAKGQVAETYMSDYQEVDGLMMPHFIETKVGGQSVQKITITAMESNPADLDMSVFDMPGN